TWMFSSILQKDPKEVPYVIVNAIDITERVELENFISANPSVQKEFNQLQLAKLTPDTSVVFRNKEILYREEEKVRVIGFNWKRIAIAAGLLLAVSTTALLVYNDRDANLPPVVAETKEVPAIQVPTPANEEKNVSLPVEKATVETSIEANNNEKKLIEGNIVETSKTPTPVKQKSVRDLNATPEQNQPVLAETKDKKETNNLPQPVNNPYVNKEIRDNPIAMVSPVTKDALTNINTYNYDGEFLTWATNGFAGFMKIIIGKFSINGDRGLLKPKIENINIHYVKHKIEPILRGLAKGRKGENGEDEFTKVYPSMIKDLLIEMPTIEDELNMEAQLELVEKINTISNINEKVYQYEQKFAELKVSLTNDFNSKEFMLSEILDLQDGFAFPSSIYTKKSQDIKLIRIQDVNGKSEPKNVRIPKDFMFSNKEKFLVRKGDYLLSLSGAAGFNLIKWSGEDGYLNQRITKLTFKSEFHSYFIEDYQESIIGQVYDELNSLGNSANNNLSRKDISRIKINIPVLESGEIDKSAQIEILNIQRKITIIKKSIIEELQKIRLPIVTLE
ncbi:MAG: hypothetical protein EOO20_21915, partial [Chryseobacterium sp.]